MNRKMLVSLGTVLLATAILLALLTLLAQSDPAAPQPARAAPLAAVPTVTEVAPTSAPNDLDTPIVISGADFVVSATVLLNDATLDDVGWVTSATLTATVPWGMEPGVYTLTVVNPGEGSGSRTDAFTVTQGIGVFTTDGPYGGDLRDIHKKPDTPTTVFALVSGVGLFISKDSGGEWELVYSVDWMTNLAFDAQDADVMYLGTWRSQQFARSMDGGQTWQTIPQIGFPGNGDGMSYPATHPTDAGKVFMSVGHPQGEILPGDGGVYRSDDYGLTWITKTEGMTDTDVQSLAIHPNDPDKMLAGTWDGNLYVSTDGGENWSLEAHLDGPVFTVYFNPYQPLEAWATAGTLDVPSLYKSTDLTTWTEVIVDASLTWGEKRWDMDFLPDTIWTAASQVYTSTDNGNNWNLVEVGSNAIEVTPDNPQEIYAAAGRGIQKSDDGGQSWRDINEGLAGIVPRAIAVSRTEPDVVYIKTRQGLFRSFNGGHAWQDLSCCGGGYPQGDELVVDTYTPTRVYLGANVQCADAFCIEISADAGETWNLVTATQPVTYAGWESGVYALAPHPQIPGRILAGNWVWPPGSAPWLEDTLAVVYASDDYGQSWTHIGLTQPISPVMDIAYDAADPDLVYMATRGSGLWKSTDGGITWQVVTDPGGRSDITEIAPHPSIFGYLVVAAGGGLYSSQDAGETWTFLDWNVQDPVVFAPTVPPVLYGNVASSQQWGFVRSTDGGLTWELVEGMPQSTRLAVGSDEERVVVYVGTPGGVVQANLEELLLGAGVYRWTSRLPTARVYLPLILRGYGP